MGADAALTDIAVGIHVVKDIVLVANIAKTVMGSN